MDDEKLFDQLRAILVEQFGVGFNEVQLGTKINSDLGIQGDDADDFFEAIEEKLGFEVEIDLGEYFDGESLFSFKQRRALTVSRLLDIIKTSNS